MFFARKMHSTSEFAMTVLSKCVCHKKARAPVRVRVRVRWGTLQSAASEDAAMFLCKHACFYISIVPPLGAYKSQLGGTYSLSLLVSTVNDPCDLNNLNICVYIII